MVSHDIGSDRTSDDLNVEKQAKNAKLDRYKDRSLINDDSDECSKQHWE